jgi:hypothetical protein
LKEGIVVKAEGIGGEREGDFTDNFNNVWKISQNCCGEFCPKHGGKLLYKKLKKTTVLAFI